jgi:hypothetical protein
MKISVVGHCQSSGLASCMQAMLPDADIFNVWHNEWSPHLKESDLIFVLSDLVDLTDKAGCWEGVDRSRIKLIPSFAYFGFHPDLVYVYNGDGWLKSPLDDYNSVLVIYGWLNGLSVKQTVRLFCDAVYERVGYYNFVEPSDKHLIEIGERCHIDMVPLLREWREHGCFAHSINHPKLFVSSGIARAALTRHGLDIAVERPEDYLQDPLTYWGIWPVYPEIAARLGVEGSCGFKVPDFLRRADRSIEILDLEQFVERSFDCYAQHPKDNIHVERLMTQRELYSGIEALVTAAPRRKRAHPYANLPNYCFWQRGVAGVRADELDPVVDPKFQLRPEDRIATAGSCFAQHIAKTLIKADYNYFVAEPAPDCMPPDAAAARGYGLFSARFGNVYSARQLLQLFQRAYGEFSPDDSAWVRPDGRFADPFRPQIEPGGYDSPAAAAAARAEHFAGVRRMFEQTSLFVFTVGLTEAWMAKSDGAVFPVAPGVVASSLDPAAYKFVNFTVSEIIADLDSFIAKLRGVNPNIRLLFTVSPVPLVATYENRHVLVSTTYSKSAIRAALDEVVRKYDFVDYFPSYEIITGWYNKGRYFADDLRSVTQEGIDHVMRLFSRHYLGSEQTVAAPATGRADALRHEFAQVAKILCDEEMLDRRASGPTDSAAKPAPVHALRAAPPVNGARRGAALHQELDAALGRIETLQAEQDNLRGQLDTLIHGVESWLLPTLQKHEAAIRRRGLRNLLPPVKLPAFGYRRSR